MEASPLYRLSPELRNKIYELVLVSPQKFVITKCEYARSKAFHQHPPMKQRRPLALAATCQRISRECTQLSYNRNSFIIRNHNDDGVPAPRLALFLQAIGEVNANALTLVTVDAGIMYFASRRNGDEGDRFRKIFLHLRRQSATLPWCDFTMTANVSNLYAFRFNYDDMESSFLRVEKKTGWTDGEPNII